MELHYYMKTFLFAGQMFGLSSKEIDVLVRDLDNLPRDRRLSNEEALAAYEIVAGKYGEKFEGLAGEERLREIIDDKDSVFDKQRAVQSARTSLKPILAEKHMKETYPDQYKSFMRETES